jgi:hypothetical protein
MAREGVEGRGEPVAFFDIYVKEPESGLEDFQSKISQDRLTNPVVNNSIRH